MDTIVVVAAVVIGGIVCGTLALFVPLYLKPRMRKRYERKHHRSKGNGRRIAP